MLLLSPAVVTTLRYHSAAKRPAHVVSPTPRGLVIRVPNPDYAARCVAIGIGAECGEMIAELANAAWFSHLRERCHGPERAADYRTPHDWVFGLEGMPAPHVASIALPAWPRREEVEIACEVGQRLRRAGAFVIMTTGEGQQAVITALGRAGDCLLRGDGSLHHHVYPTRTVIEPASGRVICYDLFDVCSLWAGRVGDYGSVVPDADALHVEVSAAVDSLADVDALVSGMAAELDEPQHLSLFNVVPGAGPGLASPTSFSDSVAVRQERAMARRDRLGEER